MRQAIPSDSVDRPAHRRIPAKKNTTLLGLVRCFAYGFGLALLLLLAANWTARLRFQSLVNERHRAGERVVLEDFQTAPLPDDQNAATYLERAAKCFTLDPMLPWVYYGVSHYELPDSARESVRKIFSAHPEILPLLGHADSCEKADWHEPLRSPVFKSVNFSFIKREDPVGQVLYPYGVYQHEVGNDSVALECVEHLLTIARAIDQQPSYPSHRAACSYDEYAAQLCLRISLRKTSERSASLPDSAEHERFKRASEKLIAEFLDEDSRMWRARQAWLEDRMECIDMFLNAEESASTRFTSEWLRYWTVSDDIPRYDPLLCASLTKRWDDARDVYARMSHAPKSYGYNLTTPPLNRLQSQFESMTARHAAALGLALRMYSDDHDGQYPADLHSLVPRYLNSIPIDPFGAPGAQLKYLSESRPAIYSVSYDGIDSGGDRTAQMDSDGGPTFSPWESRDAVFPLGGALLPADKLPKKVIIYPGAAVRNWRVPVTHDPHSGADNSRTH